MRCKLVTDESYSTLDVVLACSIPVFVNWISDVDRGWDVAERKREREM